MTGIETARAGPTAFREARPQAESGDPVVLVHGFPESSLMWEPAMRELAAAGRRSVAPDLYCLGDSSDPGPATYERSVDLLSQFVDELGLERVALVLHDWGGFVGLTWACLHPTRVAALVISATGFFSDGTWHGMAQAIRGEQGEEIVGALDHDGFAGLLRSNADFSDETIAAYWRPFEVGRGREATVEFYRSMDFSKLAPYEATLRDLDVPALLLWGEADQFAPLSGARRFKRELRNARLVAIEGAGHFVVDEEPDRCAREIATFLASA